jgi:C1A family cysteine protease
MWKKTIGFLLCIILISTAVLSTPISSLEKTTNSIDAPCLCLHSSFVSNDPVESCEVYEQTFVDIPPSWDWRDVNGSDWTTPIKDQIQDKCGSCWAFGALAGLESNIKIWKNNPTLDVDLSEQYMLSCSPGNCNGWYIDRTVKWIKTNGSIPESCLPYEADDTIPCEAKCADWRNMLIGIDGYLKIAANVTVIQSALIQYGPLPATMVVYSDFYPNFTGGIYHHTNGTLVFGHVVTIVGYDTTGEEGYWICKNSWGSAWGEGGWFRIAFDQCNIEKGVYCFTGPNYVIVKPEKPIGPAKGQPNQIYTFTAVEIDPDNDTMKYCFDWGDGILDWTDFISSGELVSINHTWSIKGNYNIRVKVQDEHGLESDWSDPLPLRIPRTDARLIFERLFSLYRIIFNLDK